MEYTFSKKQVNVIFAAMKRNEVQVPKETMGKMYYYAEHGIDGMTRFDFKMNGNVQAAVKAIFAKDFERAQQLINGFARNAEMKEKLDRFNAEGRKRMGLA